MKNALVVCVVLLLSIGLSGCANDIPNGQLPGTSTKPAVPPTPTSTVNSAGIRLKGYTWPTELMGDFPELTGDILDITTDDTSTSVDFWGMDEKAVRGYIEQLIGLGYDGEVTELASGGFIYSGENKNMVKARVVYTNTKYTVITYCSAS